METIDMTDRLNQLSNTVIGAAIEVHKALGLGLYESVYEECLMKELEMRQVKCQSQLTFKLNYKGHETGKAFRIDLLVEDELIVEIKAVDELTPLNEVQLVTYLKMLDKHLGLLINFNVTRLADGIRRKVYNMGGIKSQYPINRDIISTRFTASEQYSANFANAQHSL